MEWQGVENDSVYQRTKHESARVFKYYYVYETEEGKWKAGRFWFNKEMDFTRPSFNASQYARAYCEKIDREMVAIEAVTA